MSGWAGPLSRFLNDMQEPREFPTLEAYWRDPAPFEAERIAGQTRIDALFADHDACVRAKREALWEQDRLDAQHKGETK